MAKAYSQDLRDRVIDAVTGAGMKWPGGGPALWGGCLDGDQMGGAVSGDGQPPTCGDGRSPAIGAEAASRFPGCGAG